MAFIFHPILAPSSRMGKAIPVPPLIAYLACYWTVLHFVLLTTWNTTDNDHILCAQNVTPLQPSVFLTGIHQLLDTSKGWLQPLGRLTSVSSVSMCSVEVRNMWSYKSVPIPSLCHHGMYEESFMVYPI